MEGDRCLVQFLGPLARRQTQSPSRADVPPPAPTFPNTFSPDAACHDKTPVAGHQLFRVVQPTEWSRKTGIAGRKVEDVRLHELCHRGMAEFSMRLVSEGRFQGIVWTRSVQESVFVTSLLKKIRDAHLNIDDVARTFFTQDVPDKHKDSAKFMGPLAEELFQAMQARAPSQDPAAAGIQLTPCKKRTSEPASSAADPPAKRAKGEGDEHPDLTGHDPAVVKLLQGPPARMLDAQPRGAKDERITEWAQNF